MRIGIDATVVGPARLAGVERHAISLVRALAERAPDQIVLFVRTDAPEALSALPVERHAAPTHYPIAVEQAWVPLAAARARVDALHTLGLPTPLLWRGRSAVTVHDATLWLHPEVIPVPLRWYYGPLFAYALRRASAVLTVSDASRCDLVRALGVPADRIQVTGNGVDDRFFQARAPDGPRAPYLLAVGTLEPRKNLPTLLEAFRLLRREGRDLELVVVGRAAFGHSLPLGDLEPYVRLAGPVPDEELAALYAGTSCFVLPSLYEGFGLTLAEAMAAGAPAVASDIPALRELGGETVRYASPEAPGAFAAAIAAAVDGRDETQAMVAAARERARRFRWEACAEATLEVYRRIASGPG